MSLQDVNAVKDANTGFSDWLTLAGYVALENQLTQNSGDTTQATYETKDASTPLYKEGQPTPGSSNSNKALLIGGAVAVGLVAVVFMLKK